MVSLFSEIQGFFQAKYSGRFFSLLLRELGAREPVSFVAALGLQKSISSGLAKGTLEVIHEFRFRTSAGVQRIADLAILAGGEPIALIEVKEDDINSKTNAAQIQDYLSMLGSRGDGQIIQFIHVSRYALPALERELLKNAQGGKFVRSVSYRQIFASLNLPDTGPWGLLFRDYLGDIGVANYKSIDLTPAKDGKALAMLLTQMLGFPHTHGLGRLHSDKAADLGPELLQRLLGNVQVLADWVAAANPDTFNQRFTRKFLPQAYLDLDKLARSNLAGSEEPLPGKNGSFVRSGVVYFYAQGKISSLPDSVQRIAKNEWLYVEIGYALHIAKGGAQLVRDGLVGVEMFASFYGKIPEDVYFGSTEMLKFPTEAEAQKQLTKCLIKARAAASKIATGAFAEALNAFEIPEAI